MLLSLSQLQLHTVCSKETFINRLHSCNVRTFCIGQMLCALNLQSTTRVGGSIGLRASRWILTHEWVQAACTTLQMQPATWQSTQMPSMRSMPCMGPRRRPPTTTRPCTRTPHRERSKSMQVQLSPSPRGALQPPDTKLSSASEAVEGRKNHLRSK